MGDSLSYLIVSCYSALYVQRVKPFYDEKSGKRFHLPHDSTAKLDRSCNEDF